jgi:anhydro-N-acetylmuramic acid kinase
MSDLFLGMISGTSIDGVDAVLAEIRDDKFRIVGANTTPFPADLHTRLRKLVETPQTSLRDLGSLDVAVGRFFGECALKLIASSGRQPEDVAAIGSHGQTVYHEPLGAEPFSLQLGDPNVIAAMTGSTTVADFRRLDVALGGQGAPLVPAFTRGRSVTRATNASS